MSIRTAAARGLKWQAIEIVGRQVLSLVVFTTLARLLDPAAFGLMGLVGVYLGFVGMFVDQGIGTALIQRKDLEPQHANAAFWFNVGCAAVFCLATILLARPVAVFFDEPKLASLLRWGSLVLITNALAAVHSALFYREMDFRRPMIRTLIANVAGGAVGIGMAFGGYGVWALIGQQLTASIAGSCFLWAASPWRPALGFSLSHLRQLMAVSLSVFTTGLLWFFSSRLDQVVIGRFAGAAVLGHYVVGGKLSELARTAVHQPVGAVALPALSRIQHDAQRMSHAIYKGMELNALVSFAVFGGLAAVAPTLVPVVFGAQWQPAVPFLQLLAFYGLALGLLVFVHPAMLASASPGTYLLANGLLACGAAAACYLGIRSSPYMVIIGLTANLLVVGCVELLLLRRRMGLSPWLYCRPCIVPLIAAMAMALVVMWMRHMLQAAAPPAMSLLVQVLSGAIVYLGLLAVVQPGRLPELWQFASQGVFRTAQPA